MSSAPQAVQDLVAALFQQQRFAEAADRLSTALAEQESAELWNDWAMAQLNMGNPLDAERALSRAVSLDANHYTVKENLAILLFQQQRFALALPLLTEVLAQCPEESRATLTKLQTDCTHFAPYSLLSGDATTPAPAKTAPVADPVVTASYCDSPGDSYSKWIASVFGTDVPVPGVRLSASWHFDSPIGRRGYDALHALENESAAGLLNGIREANIPGDVVEFGIYQGYRINQLWEMTQNLGLNRRVYGFDSFEGLSAPHAEYDSSFWKAGQYACSFEEVSRNVQAANRPRIKLIKGFFDKSLKSPEALLAGPFCYVRIDCDIYEPALQCLKFLSHRLSDGCILVFDDWPHQRGIGEQRAFEEWLPSVPHLRFEFLFFVSNGHFYTRVHHRK